MMNSSLSQQRLFRLFAELLDYPQSGLSGALRECEVLLSPQSPAVAVLLQEFCSFAEEMPLGRLQEIYTGTFDLDATYHPYLGYHLFGESYKRSAFLVGLKERYQEGAFIPPENQLPDHLPVVLRFLAVCADEDTTGELICEALLPALDKILKRDGEKDERAGEDGEEPKPDRLEEERLIPPYAKLLEALQLALQQQYPTGKAVTSNV
ncbi:MAG: nitrate reductase molybdenum cofactor assembly chaperone [Candidatus Latescibacteria bacterium]|nr:nitrate reductase molybdenum cofactor assembly chaperone [Candidatus Latescibacterota bacterium]